MKYILFILTGLVTISLGLECIAAYEQTHDPVVVMTLVFFAALIVAIPWTIWRQIARAKKAKRQKELEELDTRWAFLADDKNSK
jgi:hypothetical protein